VGLPGNTYAILQAVNAKGAEAENSAIKDLKNALSQYKLFAFILHDPEQDAEFHKALNRDFNKLDQAARGKYFIFFTFIDPPAEWKNAAMKKCRAEIYDNPVIKDLLEEESSLKSKDPSMMAKAIRATLQIPPGTGPIVVVTDDLSFGRISWFQTNSKILERQIKLLCGIAEEGEGDTDRFERIRQVWCALGAGRQGAMCLKFEENKAKMLQSVVSAADNSGSDGAKLHKEAAQGIYDEIKEIKLEADEIAAEGKKHVQKLKGKLSSNPGKNVANELKEEIAYSEAQNKKIERMVKRIENLSQCLLTMIAAGVKKDTGLPPKIVADNRIYLSETAWDFLLFAYKTIEYFKEQKWDEFTPIIIMISKAFEKEIDDSIGHVIRDEKDIKLPDYFNRYQNNAIAEIQDDKGKVIADFNRYKKEDHDCWEPPPLGAIKKAFKTMINNKDIIKNAALLGGMNYNGLIDKWGEMADNYRNPAAHANKLDEEKMKGCFELFEGMAESGYFKTMNSIVCKFIKPGEKRA